MTNPTSTSSSFSSSTESFSSGNSSDNRLSTGAIAAILVGGVVGAIVALLTAICLHRKITRNGQDPNPNPDIVHGPQYPLNNVSRRIGGNLGSGYHVNSPTNGWPSLPSPSNF